MRFAKALNTLVANDEKVRACEYCSDIYADLGYRREGGEIS